MNDIVFVQASYDDEKLVSLRSKVYPPYNLALLSKYLLKQNIYDLNITIFDGNVLSEEIILNKFMNGNLIIGFTCTILNYNSTIRLAKIAKRFNNTVIIGGHFAKYFQEDNYIDYIIEGDGQMFLKDFVINTHSEHTKSFSKRLKFPLPECLFDLPDYSSLNLLTYFETFKKLYKKKYKPFDGALPNNSIRGCHYKYTHNGCSFCSIPSVKPIYQEPGLYWQNIISLKSIHKNILIWETGDSFTSNADWLRKLSLAKPKEANGVSLEIYARADEINADIAKLLKKIDVYSVFIGIETGSDLLRNNSLKSIQQTDFHKAVEILGDMGMFVIPGFILGLKGETIETLKETIDFSEQISNSNNIYETSLSTLLPIPGSRDYNSLIKKDSSVLNDKYDVSLLKDKWIKHFTNVSFDQLLVASKTIKGHYEYSGGGF